MRKYIPIVVLLACITLMPCNSSTAAQKNAVSPGSAPGIHILVPNGGESLVLGKRYPIRWTFSRVAGNIRIDLYRNKKFAGTITKSCPVSPKGYTWTVGRLTKGTAKEGNGYTLRIGTIDNKYKDYSEKPFTIVKSSSSSASSTSHAGAVSGSSGTSTLPSATSHGTTTVATPAERETKRLTNVQSRGTTIEGAPPAKGDLVKRITDLHFTNPTGGEVWEKGRTYTIRWDKAGGIGNVKILLKVLMNQSSLWVSQGENHVIKNTGYYSFRVPTTLPDSTCEFNIMTPDESYRNTSKQFYIGRTDTDLRVRAVNFGRRTEYVGAKDMPLNRKRYIVAEIWLKNKGTKRLNSVTVAWQIVKEPEGEIKTQGEKVFKNISPGSWYQQNLKVLYAESGDPKWENLWKTGGSYHLKLQADPDNVLGEIELTRGDNVYSTEVVTPSTYWQN